MLVERPSEGRKAARSEHGDQHSRSFPSKEKKMVVPQRHMYYKTLLQASCRLSEVNRGAILHQPSLDGWPRRRQRSGPGSGRHDPRGDKRRPLWVDLKYWYELQASHLASVCKTRLKKWQFTKGLCSLSSAVLRRTGMLFAWHSFPLLSILTCPTRPRQWVQGNACALFDLRRSKIKGK